MRWAEREAARRFHIERAFWQAWASERWERSPCVFELPLPAPLLTDSEARALAEQALSDAPDSVVVTVDGARVASSDPRIPALTPRAADASMAEATRRALRETGATQLAYYLSGGQLFAPELWMRCKELVRELFAEVGMPANKVDLDLFWGLYDATPSQIHKDSASLTYVVSGRKRVLVWPYETFAHLDEVARKQPRYLTSHFLGDRAPLSEYIDRAIVLEASAGQLMYWPSDYWHLGVGQGEPVLTMSVAMFLPDDLQRDYERAMRSFYGAEKPRFTSFTLPMDDPSPRTARAEALKARFLPALEDVLRQAELRHRVRATAMGFDLPPRLSTAPLTARVVRGDPRDPPQVLEATLGALLVANGHALLIGAVDERTKALLAVVARGEPFAVDDWKDQRELLEHLFGARALFEIELSPSP